jgi:hypothetical protein
MMPEPRFWSAKVFFVLCCCVLAACEPANPTIERLDVPDKADPTSVFVLDRTPRPTLTATTIIPTPTENLDPDYYFIGRMISLDDVGKTIQMREGQDFYLSLGENYTWKVEIDPPDLVSQNLKITPEPGDQGIFIARDSGLGVLRATGVPACRQSNPPCARPDLLFHVFIQVE